uniref:Glucose-methanol-choline oxidoreductase N-terminal domain-containing protein n=1 Tax=Alexandrium catenella TaxID=2925 RepID=A0A7S1L408_ALECA|mmetsp:Transcript_105911/g.282073  ORF Transcript_105911/g.282073 Transcript_105911/m.282073 type:complete len:590 (+) Transcript_105911:66-1835(+)
MSLRRLSSAVLGKRYDYVIVGAGSAGCVLAHRLTKEHGASVLLLEAGRSNRGSWDSWKINMPAALTFNLADDKYNWDYHTVPQKNLDGRRLHQPRGKVLGGSSSLNAMAYVRGHALDYERWAQEIGSSRWKYQEVLPYFKKAQCHDSGASLYRGGSGPLKVGRRRTEAVRAINEAFVQAGLQAGYPHSEDQNGFQQEGFGQMDMTVGPDGVRSSTSERYLWPLFKPQSDEDRKAAEKLTVATHSTVLGLIFDGKRAVGVEAADAQGTAYQLLANEEVILSAGAVGSPQLLMLSGVGDAAELESHGIEVRHDLPEVGKNLNDHLEFYIQYLAKHTSLYPYAATFGGFGFLSKYLFRRPWNAALAGAAWFALGRGMSATNHFEVGGFIRSAPGRAHPDMQYHFIPGCVVGQLEFLPEHGYQAHCGTLRPSSRGTVKLASKDPRAAPLIDPNFLATEADVADQRNALRLTIEILEQEAFKPFVLRRFSPNEAVDINDDAAVDAWIRENSHSGYHLSCTCAMGRVVDDQGRVLGLDGLRVVDASIMPSMSSGNLNAPTIMIAEKIADAIRGVALPAEEGAAHFEPKDWETKQR